MKLTHLNPMFHFYTFSERQKNFSVLTFSEIAEIQH